MENTGNDPVTSRKLSTYVHDMLFISFISFILADVVFFLVNDAKLMIVGYKLMIIW